MKRSLFLAFFYSSTVFAQHQCLSIYAKSYGLRAADKYYPISQDSNTDFSERSKFEKATEEVILRDGSDRKLESKLKGFEKLDLYKHAQSVAKSFGLNCCFYPGALNFGESGACQVSACYGELGVRYLEERFDSFQYFHDSRIYRSVDKKLIFDRVRDANYCKTKMSDLRHGQKLIFSISGYSFELRDILDKHFGNWASEPEPSDESRALISKLIDLNGDYSELVNNFIEIEQERIDNLPPPEPKPEVVDNRNGFEKFMDGLAKTAEIIDTASKFIGPSKQGLKTESKQ